MIRQRRRSGELNQENWKNDLPMDEHGPISCFGWSWVCRSTQETDEPSILFHGLVASNPMWKAAARSGALDQEWIRLSGETKWEPPSPKLGGSLASAIRWGRGWSPALVVNGRDPVSAVVLKACASKPSLVSRAAVTFFTAISESGDATKTYRHTILFLPFHLNLVRRASC
jgi:hypothetical protein